MVQFGRLVQFGKVKRLGLTSIERGAKVHILRPTQQAVPLRGTDANGSNSSMVQLDWERPVAAVGSPSGGDGTDGDQMLAVGSPERPRRGKVNDPPTGLQKLESRSVGQPRAEGPGSGEGGVTPAGPPRRGPTSPGHAASRPSDALFVLFGSLRPFSF